jgi:4-diphosphocytidyl-2-C-methyl-D-erythritol kinase
MPALTDLSAPAKLNLFLHVTGRRPDGFHLLQSVFVLIDWADILHIETRQDGQLRRIDLGPALPATDLCLRAAQMLQEASGCQLGADIHIDKRVPWGAGMGGGSSDAATVLMALNELWGLDWPQPRLAELALRLGADVPFFIMGRHAWVEGVGDQITPIVLPDQVLACPLAVLKPPVAIPTAAIFTSPNLVRDTPRDTLAAFLAAPSRFGHNDLQWPAVAYSDQVSRALEVMQSRFGNSRMTGSGSAVFSWVEPGHTLPTSSFEPADVGLTDPAWVGRLCRLLPGC